MSKRRRLIVLVVLLLVGVGLLVLRGPLVGLVLSNWSRDNLNGTLKYDGLRLGWDSVILDNVRLVQADGSEPLKARDLAVSFNVHRIGSMAALTRIDIDGLYLHVVLQKDGTFNLPGFIKPSKVPGPPIWAHGQFGGLLEFAQARIEYEDDTRGGFTTVFDNVEGKVDARQGPLVALMRGSEVGEARPFDLHAYMDEDRHWYALRSHFVGLDLVHWGNYLLSGQPLQVRGGRADVDATVSGDVDDEGRARSAPDLVMHGQFEHGVLDFSALGQTALEVSGRFAATSDLLRLDNVAGSIGPVKARVDGELFHLQAPQLSLTVRTGSTDIHRLLMLLHQPFPIPVIGTGEGVLAVSGSLHNPEVVGLATASHLWVVGRRIDQVVAHFHWLDGSLLLPSVSGRLGAGRFEGRGYVVADGHKPRMWIKLAAQDVDLKSASPLISGTGTVNLTVLGSPPHPLVLGDATVIHGSVRGYPFQRASSHFALYRDAMSLSNTRVDLPGLTVELPTSYIDRRIVYAPGGTAVWNGRSARFDAVVALQPSLAGQVVVQSGPARLVVVGSPQQGYAFSGESGSFAGTGLATPAGVVQAWVRGLGLDAHSWMADAHGQADVEATVAGTVSNWRADYLLAGRGLTVRGLPVSGGTGGVLGGGGSYWLDDNLLAGPWDLLRASGRVSPSAVDLQVQADVTDLRHVSRLQGSAEASGRVYGVLAAPTFQGFLRISDGTVGHTNFSLDSTLSANRDRLHLVRSIVRQNGGEVRAQGDVLLGQVPGFNLAVQAKDVDLSAITPYVTEGRASANLQVHGTSRAPLLAGTVRVDAAQVSGQSITHAEAQFSTHGKTVRVDRLSATVPDGGSIQAHGTVGSAIDMTAQVHHLPIQWQKNYAHVDAQGHVGGTLAHPQADLVADSSDVSVAGHAAKGTLHVQGHWQPQALRVDDLSYQGPEGSLTGRAAWQRRSGWSGEAHVKDLDLSVVPYPVSGHLTADATLVGSKADATFNVTQGTVNAFHFDTLSGHVQSANDVLTLDKIAVQTGPHQITADGTVPYRYENGHLLSPAPMDVHAHVDEPDLDVLSLIVPDIESTSGHLSADVRATGTFQSPVVEGGIDVANGSIKFKGLQDPISNLNLKVAVADGKATVDTLTGTLGRGRFQGSGSVSDTVDLSFKGSALDVNSPPYFVGSGSVDLHLAGPRAKPVLSGTVTADNATVQVPANGLTAATATSGAPLEPLAFLPKMDLDVTLDAKAVTLSVLGSSALARGQVVLKGSTPDVAPDGRLIVYSGNITLPLLGTFRIVRGFSRWDGTNWLPYLDVQTENLIGGYDIFAHYQADLANPPETPMTFTSSPPLGQSDILALLSGRAPSSNVAGGAPVQPGLLQSAQYMLLSSALQPLGRSLALTAITVEPVIPNSYAIKLARALDSQERFLLTLTRIYGQLGETQRVLGLEYHPRVNFMLRAESGDNNYQSFFFQLTRRF